MPDPSRHPIFPLGSALVLGVLLVVGCGGKAGEEEATAPCLQVGKDFASAIQRGDFAKAYNQCSNLYRIGKNAEVFASEQRSNLAEFEPILGTEEPQQGWSAKEARNMADDLEIPADIPKDSYNCWVSVPLVVEYDEEGGNLRCFLLEILVVDDGGTLRVGHFDYEWCD